MNLQELLEEKSQIINRELNEYIKGEENPQKTIYEAMNYSVKAGGKRLRPVIMLMVCDMFGGCEKDVIPFACALEMIHTYSLIHDDLPAMDNDDLRRGKPTNHKVFGEAMAILSGDALLNKAFEVVASNSYKNSENAIKAMAYLFNASGTEGMIGGQVVDIESENKKIDEATLLYIHKLKTGALIKAAGVVGAIMSGASAEEIRAIEEYCLNLGIAFQIQDDVLDVEGNEEQLGKPIGSDSDNNKTTYVTLWGIDRAKKGVLEYSKKATDALNIFGEKAEALILLTNYLINRDN